MGHRRYRYCVVFNSAALGRTAGTGVLICTLPSAIPPAMTDTICASEVPTLSAQLTPTLSCAFASPPGKSHRPRIMVTFGRLLRNCRHSDLAWPAAKGGRADTHTILALSC